MLKRVGVLTVGGDAPGQNVCLKALVYSATEQGLRVIGIRKGWEGLVRCDPTDARSRAENLMELSTMHVRDIDRTPGSFLHSSRIDPLALEGDYAPGLRSRSSNGKTLDASGYIAQTVQALGLEALVVIGDRAGLTSAAQLSEQGVPIIGIPKTVHNNVSGSDYAIGFSSAIARGVHIIHELRATAGSREEIAVVEILGRSSGLTTMLISFLAGADRTLIPEVPFDPERLAELLRSDKQSNSNNYAILTLSEATSILPELERKYLPELSRLANARTLADVFAVGESQSVEDEILRTIDGSRQVGRHVIGTGAVVTEILETKLGERLMYQPLSYLIRTGDPDGQDLLGAMNFAMTAVKLLVSGKTGRLVAYRRRDNYIDCPIHEVKEPQPDAELASYYDAAEYCAAPSILWASRW